MNAFEVFHCILTLATRYNFSTTSCLRTKKRNAEVGGVANSRHLLFLAWDIVLEDTADKDSFTADAQRMHLVVIDETDHLHVQAP